MNRKGSQQLTASQTEQPIVPARFSPLPAPLARWPLSLAALLLSLSISVPASALSSAEAAQQVQRRYGGQVLDIRKVRSNNTAAYRVKLLQPSGRVKLLLIDAGSGKPISGQKKRKPGK